MASRDSVGIPEDTDKLERFKGWFKAARSQQHDWRKEAREMYDFYAGYGKQWSEEDAAAMKLQMRPIVEFNRTAAIVDSVCGLEVNNRQEVRYIPRVLGKSGVNELRTEAARWVRDETNAEDEESDAFFDTLVTGVGVTETRLDYDEDPNGKLLILRTDPMEMLWDAQARRRNLVDARHMFRFKDIPLSDAIDMAEKEGFPSTEPEDLHAFWAMDAVSDSAEPHDAQWAPYYRTDQAPDLDKMRTKIRMVEVQWWEHEKAWRVVNPLTRQVETVDDKTYSKIKKRFKNIVAAKFNRKCYYRALLGNIILKEWDGPKDGGFTYKFITGKRDRNKGIWYGIVRAMKDPQRWANKWLSQVLHIVNTNAKGGIMAEADAFDDIRRAQQEWAEPDSIVVMQHGAISQNKVAPRPAPQIPQQLTDLLTLAISSIRDTTGINLELLGLVERDQPGIVEHARKQAGMTVLAQTFDALRRYRKDQGRLMLWYITNFLADGRLIRIGGPSEAQFVPLVHQGDTVEYDVIVDDTPTSPNLKERTWATLVALMPFLSKMPVPPQIYLELLKYSPLPDSVTAKITAIAAAQPPQPNPATIMAQGRMLVDQSKARLNDAQAQKVGMDAAIGSAQARAENARTQVEAARSAMEAEEAKARIENLRAQAMANLAKAGATGQGANTDSMLAVLEMLDTIVGWHQNAQQIETQQNAPTTASVQ